MIHSIEHALELGFRAVKLNCVVMRGVNEDQVLNFVAYTRDHPVNVRFIEYMPFDGREIGWNAWKEINSLQGIDGTATSWYPTVTLSIALNRSMARLSSSPMMRTTLPR